MSSLRKETERAAKKGQKLIVSKKKQEGEDYKQEMKQESDRNAEYQHKLQQVLEQLKQVDEKLEEFGVTIPEVDALCE